LLKRKWRMQNSKTRRTGNEPSMMQPNRHRLDVHTGWHSNNERVFGFLLKRSARPRVQNRDMDLEAWTALTPQIRFGVDSLSETTDANDGRFRAYWSSSREPPQTCTARGQAHDQRVCQLTASYAGIPMALAFVPETARHGCKKKTEQRRNPQRERANTHPQACNARV
jgi:hypothetical protein